MRPVDLPEEFRRTADRLVIGVVGGTILRGVREYTGVGAAGARPLLLRCY